MAIPRKTAPQRAATHKPARIAAKDGSKTDAVIEAAVALVRAEGEGALGWNRLAQSLGVKPPSLYNHVASAAELERKVAIYGWSVLAQASSRAVAAVRGPKDQRAHGQLRAIARSYRRFAHDEPGLFAIASRTRLRPDEPDFLAASTALLSLFAEPLAALGLEGAPAIHAIRLLRAAVHGFVVLERGGQFAMDVSAEASFEALLQRLPALAR